ncbi:MAG: hypothetical protein KF861_20705, partial [Planctomycetaceae bacterium]|nr:hypothetical protein [Planctomycetaceae bacterium]
MKARPLSPVVLGLVGVLGSLDASRGAEPSFVRDVRPLLAAKCFACHGPDDESREADLRLDVREAAIASAAIVPGSPEE